MGVKLEKIAVIGASLGGLTTAVALKRKGYPISIYDTSTGDIEGETALCLWPSALKAYKKLGLYDSIVKEGSVINEYVINDSDSGQLARAGLNHKDLPGIGIRFKALRQILLKEIPADAIHTRKVFKRFENINSEVTASFEGGNSINCDLLIGADGLYSKVREQIINDGKPNFRGYMAWYGVIQYSHSDIPSHAFLEAWGKGKRFGTFPCGNNSICWWATANETIKEYQHMSGRKKKLIGMFKKFYSPIPSIINATPDENIVKVPVYDRAPASRWHNGRAVLLGDAAHPVTVDRGMGATLAVEDAGLLANLLASNTNVETALQQYESQRMPRAAFINAEVQRHGEVGQWENRWALLYRNFYMKRMKEEKIRQTLDGMLVYDFE